MYQKLLDLRPKRYLCPYCGEWHEYELLNELGYYDSRDNKAKFKCESCDIIPVRIFFRNGYCHYETRFSCPAANLEIKDSIQIEDFVSSSTEPRVTFVIPINADEEICKDECDDCFFKKECMICKLAEKNNSRDMNITFGFEFEQSDYEELVKSDILARKESEDVVKVKEHEKQEIKENATTKNKIFNLNIEIGPNKDENIASTLMGIAVKNGDNWRIYDKKKKEITDVGDMQLGNLPIFILPATKLNEGDLIKDAGEYYYVMQVEKKSIQILCAKTGKMKTVIPIKNVLGFSCYSKVITLRDYINVGDDLNVEKLAIMSTMCGQNSEDGNQMNQLFLLMLDRLMDKKKGERPSQQSDK